jgi:hypothetical protein
MLFKFFSTNILRKNITLFVATNLPELTKKLDIDRKSSAAQWLLSALGALGRRFEYCRPDQLKQ